VINVVTKCLPGASVRNIDVTDTKSYYYVIIYCISSYCFYYKTLHLKLPEVLAGCQGGRLSLHHLCVDFSCYFPLCVYLFVVHLRRCQ
jgi:hypothetical protein